MQGKIRHVTGQVAETAFVDRQQVAVFLRDDAGGARRVVDECQFPKDRTALGGFDNLAAQDDIHRAGHQHIHRIAGIALVQELQDGWDALIIVDTIDWAKSPGTILVIDPDVVDVESLDWAARHDLLADMHLATPERALMLAKALGVLPHVVRLIGCQPLDAGRVGIGLDPIVAAAVDEAITQVWTEVEAITQQFSHD